MAGSADAVAPELVEAARGYEALFVPALFGEWSGPLIEAAGIGPGDAVLDVACGTGVVARAVAEVVGSRGSVVGADPAPGMLAVAREQAPDIDWRLCGAESLLAEDGRFDAVLCQFGMMFFADRMAAMAEMARVLRPGGGLALSVWDRVAANPAYAEEMAFLEAEIGAAAADAVRIPFGLGDPEAVLEPIRAAGFSDISLETRAGQGRFPSAQVMLEAELRGWLPLFGIQLSEARIKSLLAQAEEVQAEYVIASGEVVFPTSAHIVTAKKPA